MVYFIGAGPGDPELLTIKGKKIIDSADLIIYAGSLVNPLVLKDSKPEAEIYNSAELNLEEVIELMKAAEGQNKITARVHTGDPAIYGAHREQMRELDRLGIKYKVIPGVSSFTAAAASLNIEYTLPEISQTVILTRLEGRTLMPQRESIEELAAHRASMVIFLSIGKIGELVERLCRHYPVFTPAAAVYKASWEEEKLVRGTLADIVEKTSQAGIKKTALLLVGEVLGNKFGYSKLYDKNFSHKYRRAVNAQASENNSNQTISACSDSFTLKAAEKNISLNLHGGNILEIAPGNIDNFIDFSANINPFGIDEKIKANIINSLELIKHYPLHTNQSLIRKIALKHEVPEGAVILGNGAEDIVFRIINLFKRDIKVLLTAPGFSGYEAALNAYNKNQAVYYYLNQNMNIGRDYLDYLDRKIDAAFITLPNNPTGIIPDQGLLNEIFDKCVKNNILLVVDECFLDFVREKAQYSFISRLKDYNKLIILKSFTKLYAIPGLRLGYALCGSRNIIAALVRESPYWQVNSLAMAAGEAALELDMQQIIDYISGEREYLISRLKSFNLKVYEGQANYLLFKTPCSCNLYERCLENNLIIRKCESFKGLDAAYYRIAVRTHEENIRLIAVFEKLFAEGE